MKIANQRINYGILVGVDLAMQSMAEPVQARVIAKRQGIPVRVLEQVVNALKRAGLVESTRGAQGGYRLLKRPSEISVAQIVEALEGPLVVPVTGATVSPSGETVRRGSDQQVLLSRIWHRIHQVQMDLLNQITLSQVAEDYQALQQRRSPMYHI